jgi:uncharacterized protein YecE (DUF72 family)
VTILTGTASWTHRTLLESGWYPREAATPAARLAYYASRFPIVEVDSAYYAIPGESTVAGWIERTPPGFVFNVKAYSLLTGHPTRAATLPGDLRPGRARSTVYATDLPAADVAAVWRRFAEAVAPLHRADRLGAVLLQFPPWLRPGGTGRRRILDAAARLAPLPVAVELRSGAWFAPGERERTFAFLREHGLPFVCVDMPQGHASSVPPVAEVTAPLAMLRLHGRSPDWGSRDLDEKFRWTYDDAELAAWADRVRGLAQRADRVHVLFNNCCADTSQRNAERFRDLVAQPAGRPAG